MFEVLSPIDRHTITTDSDGEDWSFTDKNIQSLLPKRQNGDILIAITNVPLQDNYYTRRFENNCICITYNETTEYLKDNNIPLENFLLKVLYSASFVYKRYGNKLPEMFEMTNFTHDETRGCIFDMNGIKTDIVYSTDKPQLCNSCILALTDARIEQNLIDKVQFELRKINKDLYYRIFDYIKSNPKSAIFISSISAIILGIIGSVIASWIWEKI